MLRPPTREGHQGRRRPGLGPPPREGRLRRHDPGLPMAS
uniref:Uncharacterized protein n=1 Tax=Arundo donax TaxID=35708 RepID=A0A0A8YNR6_ARUDO